YLELKEAVRARYIKYVHEHVGSPNLAISDIRVFGRAEGAAPPVPLNLTVRREDDERNAFVTWEDVPGVVGYNLRWGIAPGKLYQTYQVFADHPAKLSLRALTVGQSYSFAIESFDEHGVSALSPTVDIK
ncbi:MAG TPA: fibronectin type III domain-containing protein, partial [Verrucomicrobiae bacterium]|nr:fibronectin type III domain-containing protein [Verrucomicrobiae bacterium]